MSQRAAVETNPLLRRRLTIGFAAILFFIVLGSQWAVLDRFGSDIPNWDQWDAEGLECLVPWFHHDHFIQHLFHPQNEHRVVLTKLQNLSLTLLAGQWDSRVQCASNAMLHAGIAAACWLAACSWLCGAGDDNGSRSRRWGFGLLAFILTAAVFALPISWQNILSGFHSQQYWLIGLSVVAIATLPWQQPLRGRWWAAVVVTGLALLSMASGLFAALTVLVILGLRILVPATVTAPDRNGGATVRAVWPTLLICAVFVAIGFATRVEVPYHEFLKAHSLHDFCLSIVRSLAFPIEQHDWSAVLLWAPWVILAVQITRTLLGRRQIANAAAINRVELTLLGLGGWVLAQIVATAYARGSGGDYPTSRYMDTVAFGNWVNGTTMLWFGLRSLRTGRTARAVAAAGCVVWAAAFGLGLRAILHRNFSIEMPDTAGYYREAEAHLRGYLATGDAAQLAFKQVPYPSGDALIERLKHQSLRSLMPVSVRPPLPMAVDAVHRNASTGFLENDASELHLPDAPRHGLPPQAAVLASIPAWGSFGDRGATNTAAWRSTTLTAPLHGWLKFETAGDLGNPSANVGLELHDAKTDAVLASVRPSKIPGLTWRAAYVRTPNRPFVVVAHDNDSHHWLGFSAPVEMSSLSYWAWQCVKQGLLVMYFAIECGVVLAILGVIAEWRTANATD